MSEQAVDAKIAALITKVRIENTANASISGWLVNSMLAGSDFPGFVSAEILPPENLQNPEWVLVQRFRSDSQIGAWRKSPAQAGLLAELEAAYSKNGLR